MQHQCTAPWVSVGSSCMVLGSSVDVERPASIFPVSIAGAKRICRDQGGWLAGSSDAMTAARILSMVESQRNSAPIDSPRSAVVLIDGIATMNASIGSTQSGRRIFDGMLSSGHAETSFSLPPGEQLVASKPSCPNDW